MTDGLDWGVFTLFLYILMRMSGFVLFNPILGRTGLPGLFKAGMILLLSLSVLSSYQGTAEVPNTALEFGLKLFLELGAGFLVAVILNLFFYVAELAGEVSDTQMGMSMAKTYDAGAQSSLTVTANLLRILMILIFFAENGHLTLFRLMLTSGAVVPFGSAALGDGAANCVIQLFLECTLLGVKLCLPILAAQLLGQIGMGILMKVIPQINVFAINIELKVLVGLSMVLLLLSPFTEFLLGVESTMLTEIQQALSLMG